MKQALVAMVLVLGCANASANRESTIPEAGRAQWDACRAAVTNYCHTLGHGDPATENRCERDAVEQYAALTTDAARTQYLTSHGCSAARPAM